VLGGPAREFLEAPRRFATLATVNPDGSPLQAVLWYALRGDAILVNSRVGRQWPSNLLRDPRASFMVEDGYDYVAVRCEAQAIDDPVQGLADISQLARAYHPPEKAEQIIRDTFSAQQRISFLLHPRSVLIHS
jgi:PPOX class probable F420-dependent enzyme